MRSLIKYIIIVKLILISYVAASYAGSGKAAVYKVTMRKVEFCYNRSSADISDVSIQRRIRHLPRDVGIIFYSAK